MNSHGKVLERQIEKIKADLGEIESVRFGSLSKQYNTCGTPGCRCKASPPKKHGPYYQVSYTRKGKSSTRAVKKEDLAEVKKQLKGYARAKDLFERWMDLATELSELTIRERNESSGKC